MIKKLIIIFFGIVALFLLVGFLLPSEFRVERSITINAPVEKVYPKVADLKQWRQWGVWFQRDPQMTVTYQGRVAAVGMKSSWQSDSEGSGEMQIKTLIPNKMMVYSLYFPEFEMGSTGEFEFIDQGQQTRVVWLDYGDVGSNPVNRYFAVMMDSMIGPDFETGLANLKVLVESN